MVSRQEPIATSSIEEALDFACNLLTSILHREAEENPEKIRQLLSELVQYISLRYVGEFLLALEYLAGLGNLCNPNFSNSEQFWCQIRWTANKMNLSVLEKERLQIPNK
jgi:hypothetical protein